MLGYLINQYPMASLTFVKREIAADGARGRLVFEQAAVPRSAASTPLPAVTFSFFEPAAQQISVAIERHKSANGQTRLARQMETMDVVEEEQGAYALVQVVAVPPESIQSSALLQEVTQRRRVAVSVHRTVAEFRIR